MAKKHYSFEDYLKENVYVSDLSNIEHNIDFTLIAPQFFHNGFTVGSTWFNEWVDKNGFHISTNEQDLNYINVFQGGKWIAAYHQHKGQIYTNRTIQELHESVEFDNYEEVSESVNEKRFDVYGYEKHASIQSTDDIIQADDIEDAIEKVKPIFKKNSKLLYVEIERKGAHPIRVLKDGTVKESIEDFEDLNEASLNKLYKDLAKVQMKMKELAKKYKDGDKSVVPELKKLTSQKKKLEAQIEDEVGMLDDQFDESLTEADMSKYSVGDIIKWRSPKGIIDGEIIKIDSKGYLKIKYGKGSEGTIPYQSVVESMTSDNLKIIYKKIKPFIKGNNIEKGILDYLDDRADNLSDKEMDILYNRMLKLVGLNPSDYKSKKINQLENDIANKLAKELYSFESVTEASKLTKFLRKLGWHGDTWTPAEYKTQIRELPDEILLQWYNRKDSPIPNIPLEFQQKLVKSEVERRGLKESIVDTISEASNILNSVNESGSADLDSQLESVIEKLEAVLATKK